MVGTSLRYFYIYITDKGLNMFHGDPLGQAHRSIFFLTYAKPENILYSRVFTLTFIVR
jgi:hypothetical protein